MSFDAIRWALMQDLPSLESLVLIRLADCVNKTNGHDYCWPTQQQLAKATNLSRATINKMLKQLAGRQLIEIERRYSQKNGHQESAIYRLLLSKVNGVDIVQSQRDDTPKSTSCTSKVNEVDNYKEESRNIPGIYQESFARARARGGTAGAVPKKNGVSKKATSTKKAARRQRQSDQPIVVPDWLPGRVWQEWIKHREHIGKPMSEYAQALFIKRLDELRNKHDIIELMSRSIISNNPDIYPEQDKSNGATENKRLSAYERRQKELDDWLKEQTGKTEAEWKQHDASEIDGIRIQ